MNEGDEHWMAMALAEAARGDGLTSPNPPVGAVIVHGGRVLGTGWHRKAGSPHAEIEALAIVQPQDQALLRDASLFITLEPCSTHGRTPPCVDAILAAGFTRVVWAVDDPYPGHAGRAQAMLCEAGIKVTTGVLREQALRLIAPFVRRITTGLPWVTMKAGTSLDGSITLPPGEGQWLTSEASRADAMRLRSQCDAIMAGAETIRVDDPALTTRGPAISPEKEQPWRVILTNSGNLPPEAQVFTDAWAARTLVRQNQPMETVLRELAEMGCCRVLIEGGGRIHAAALSAGLVNEIILYMAPLLSPDGVPVVAPGILAARSVPLSIEKVERIGQDIRIQALVRDP